MTFSLNPRPLLAVFATLLALASVGVSGAQEEEAPAPAPTAAPTATPRPSPTPTPSPSPTPEPLITVAGTAPTPLLVDGVEADRVPKNVKVGTTVCAQDGVFYKSQGERWTFQGWSNDVADACQTLTRAGVYRPIYTQEVLVVVQSAVSAFQQSMWVQYGTPVTLEVPDSVGVTGSTAPGSKIAADTGDASRDRFRFVQWTDGETPFQTKNTIAAVKPITVEVKWIRERYVVAEGPQVAAVKGTGWYEDGSTLALRTPDFLPGDSAQERWKFDRWEGTTFPVPIIQNATSPLIQLKVDAAYGVRAVYTRQFQVEARNPMGTIRRDWVNEGQEVVLETPPIVDVVPETERLVFRKWEGIDNVSSPKFSGFANRPISVVAVYDRQFMLKVTAPYGVSGDGWYRQGTVATVSVPASMTQMYLWRTLFAGFGGANGTQNTVQVMMDEPRVMAAIYRSELDRETLAMLVLPIFALILAAITRWLLIARPARLRKQAPSPAPAIQVNLPANTSKVLAAPPVARYGAPSKAPDQSSPR